MGWPRGDKNGQWWGYDLPVYRDWLFWVVTVGCVGLSIFALSTGTNWVACVFNFAVSVVPSGVLPASVRNFWRGFRVDPPPRIDGASSVVE